jgi:hypothetical protein
MGTADCDKPSSPDTRSWLQFLDARIHRNGAAKATQTDDQPVSANHEAASVSFRVSRPNDILVTAANLVAD